MVEEVSMVPKESAVYWLGDSIGLLAGVIPCPVVFILILKKYSSIRYLLYLPRCYEVESLSNHLHLSLY